MIISKLQEHSREYPIPSGGYAYGTAGFRYPADRLAPAVFRTGLVAASRSIHLKSAYVGVMLTASHNPARDNGVKVVEPMGEMLVAEWEPYATKIGNAPDPLEVMNTLNLPMDGIARVVIARDTRPSGEELTKALRKGLECFEDVEILDFGEATTPQLHYYVRTRNDPAYGKPDHDGYFIKMGAAFNELMGNHGSARKITVDCANGIGCVALETLKKFVDSKLIDIAVVNDNIRDPQVLNLNVGADYVKTKVVAPAGLDKAGVEYASLDGDADRVVLYYTDSNGTFHLLDGDKIATLVTGYLQELVQQLGPIAIPGTKKILGMIQTAYANGASTNYATHQLKVPVSCTKTGVKNLHSEAEHSYYMGVYFEPNGHGTVLFNPGLVNYLKEQSNPAAKKLLNLSNLINQTVGDAISDLLLVLAVLSDGSYTSFAEWDHAYHDLPSLYRVVRVRDRSSFKTTDVDRKLAEPPGLQPEIDRLVAKYQSGRSFVRPSGTEDVVRIYAEASTREQVEALSLSVAQLVFDKGDGTGERPT